MILTAHTPRALAGSGQVLASLAALLLAGVPALCAGARPLPRPLPDHPGNIFVAGETVRIPTPGWAGATAELRDYEGRWRATFTNTGALLELGPLPEGYYEIGKPGAPNTTTNRTALAVLPPLRAPTSTQSPIGIDVAMSWFYPSNRMTAVAQLCALAGVAWVRDRLNWSRIEAEPGRFEVATAYDSSAKAQAAAGLQILQVNHLSPAWAATETRRFPDDLRTLHRFYHEMAERWPVGVRAFEPWNEPDIPMFGGHTGAEIASLQKAAALGIWSGNPKALACQAVFALHHRSQLADFRANEAWPYFQTFNFHHYVPFEDYPALYGDFRLAAAGRPLWVTEAALPVRWSDAASEEPTDADLRLQAERLPKTFACSLHEGAQTLFYFLLPHYVEGPTQFGILRRDLTPRPAFLALAAVGRLLAEAQPLGQWQPTAAARVYAFRARPDGRRHEVWIAWSDAGPVTLELPAAPEAVFDHLGRSVAAGGSLQLSTAPLFLVMPDRASRLVNLRPAPAPLPRAEGKPSPVVLQAIWPESQVVLKKSAYRVDTTRTVSIPVFAYNFSKRPLRGQLRIETPAGWVTTAPAVLDLHPGQRLAVPLEIDARGTPARLIERVTLRADFGAQGRPILALRLMPEPGQLAAQHRHALHSTLTTDRWEPQVSGGPVHLGVRDGQLDVEARPTGSDRWVYPTATLKPGERAPSHAQGLAFSWTRLAGSGECRVILEEANGSSYVISLPPPPQAGVQTNWVAWFDDAVPGTGWSKPDPNHRLDAAEIRRVKLGCNTRDDRVQFRIGEPQWILGDESD